MAKKSAEILEELEPIEEGLEKAKPGLIKKAARVVKASRNATKARRVGKIVLKKASKKVKRQVLSQAAKQVMKSGPRVGKQIGKQVAKKAAEKGFIKTATARSIEAAGAKLGRKAATKATKKIATTGAKAGLEIGGKAATEGIPVIGWVILIADGAWQLHGTSKQYKKAKKDFLKWSVKKQNAFIKKCPIEAQNVLFKMSKKDRKAFAEKNKEGAEFLRKKSKFFTKLLNNPMRGVFYGTDAIKKMFAIDLVGDISEVAGVKNTILTSTAETRIKDFSEEHDALEQSLKNGEGLKKADDRAVALAAQSVSANTKGRAPKIQAARAKA